MGVTGDIAQFALSTGIDDFTPALVKYTKQVLLSSIGMTMVGVKTTTGKRVVDYFKKMPAAQEAGVFGAGYRTSVGYATIANGTTSHSTELEDDAPPDLATDVGYFPAIFALGESLRVSGRDIIESFVIAFDISSKLTHSIYASAARRGGLGPYFCAVGVAAASARMLKLSPQEATMAVSLAVSQANWFLWFQGGSDAHFYEQGVAMRNGIDSAFLARHGFTGNPAVLEMPGGYLNSVAEGAFEPPVFGKPYRVMDIGIKKYPCCYLEMNYIDAFVDVIRKYRLAADQIESIQVDVAPVTAQVLRFHHPKDEMEARFSLSHSIAVAFVDKKPWFQSYSTESANDPRMKALRDRVKMVVHPEWAVPESPLGAEMPIVIKMKNGAEYKAVSRKPTDPISVSDDELMDKYMKCALEVVSKGRAERIAETVLSLEKVPDISDLMKMVTFPDKP